jgi:hypothetical protein
MEVSCDGGISDLVLLVSVLLPVIDKCCVPENTGWRKEAGDKEIPVRQIIFGLGSL